MAGLCSFKQNFWLCQKLALVKDSSEKLTSTGLMSQLVLCMTVACHNCFLSQLVKYGLYGICFVWPQWKICYLGMYKGSVLVKMPSQTMASYSVFITILYVYIDIPSVFNTGFF